MREGLPPDHPIPNEQPEELYLITREATVVSRFRVAELEQMFASRDPRNHAAGESYADWLSGRLRNTEDFSSYADIICLLQHAEKEELRIVGADMAVMTELEIAVPRVQTAIRGYLQDPSPRVRERMVHAWLLPDDVQIGWVQSNPRLRDQGGQADGRPG